MIIDKNSYRQLFEANPHPMMIYDLQTLAFLAVNDAAIHHYGYSRDEFLDMTLRDIHPPQEHPRLLENIARITSGIDAAGVWQHLKKDGQIILVEIISHTLEFGGRATEIFYAHDITERVHIEKRLQENEAFLQAVLDNLPIGVAVNSVDPTVTFNYMNDNFPKFYRTTREQLATPDSFWEAVYEDPLYRETIKNRVLQGCAGNDPAQMIWRDIPLTRKGKETRFITARNTPINDKKLMISSVWDVTERKQAAAERERLQLAIEQTGEMILITDPAGTIQYVNPAFEQITGYSRDEIVGQNPRILKSGEHDESFYHDLWATISRGETFQGQIVNRRKNAELYTEEATISPICDETGKIVSYVAVKHDITEQLRLAAQYQQAQKMESVGRLAGGVAHDYNNMLSVIIGYTQLALLKTPPEHPVIPQLREIMKAAQRSAEMTKQLLAFARQQTINPKILDMNQTVESMLSMLRQLIGENIDLLWQPGNIPWTIKVDPGQLDQILTNLCVNARDAIEDIGKITIETGAVTFDEQYCAEHAGFIPGNFAMLAVSDDGCGMAPETLEAIFEPFFTTKQMNKGTGLGLATVYGIVKQNQGFINVYSEPGHGTTIRIYLPTHSDKASEHTEEQIAESPSGQGELILLVDDETSLVVLGRKMLELLGYQVISANSPHEAIALAQHHTGQIDLLLTDVVMPEMNGRDLAHRLQQDYPRLKTLYMSGYTANVIAHRGVLDKDVNFIQKPLFFDELARQVRVALAGTDR